MHEMAVFGQERDVLVSGPHPRTGRARARPAHAGERVMTDSSLILQLRITTFSTLPTMLNATGVLPVSGFPHHGPPLSVWPLQSTITSLSRMQ